MRYICIKIEFFDGCAHKKFDSLRLFKMKIWTSANIYFFFRKSNQLDRRQIYIKKNLKELFSGGGRGWKIHYYMARTKYATHKMRATARDGLEYVLLVRFHKTNLHIAGSSLPSSIVLCP